jgi:hypothetical protein
MKNIDIIEGGNGNLSLIPNGQNTQVRIIPDSVGQSPAQSNLIYLFDPVYYNGYTNASTTFFSFLKNIFNKYPSILPASDYVLTRGEILNKIDDLNNLQRKQYFDKSNFVFSYEKYSDDSDVPLTQNMNVGLSDVYGVKERKKALLKLLDPIGYMGNTFNLLADNTSKTFSCFVKLKGPVKHRSYGTTATNKIIREKKGIFLNTGQFAIGYRSPHYTRTGNVNGYKFKFEPFSFVFSIQDNYRNHSFMTDFKYEFGKTYHLTITLESGSEVTVPGSPTWYYTPTTVKVYVNGEQQTTAYLHFNPLIRGNNADNTKGGKKSKLKYERIETSPIQPNFYSLNGLIYPSSNSHNIQSKMGNKNGAIGWTNLYLGKSNLSKGGLNYGIGGRRSTKRYLSNIDVGVIHVYNSVLSNSDIQKIYNVFGPRYQ